MSLNLNSPSHRSLNNKPSLTSLIRQIDDWRTKVEKEIRDHDYIELQYLKARKSAPTIFEDL